MVKIKEAIVVEGRYDKNTLSQILDAPILETSGFGIFKDKQQMALLRAIAENRGLIVFTDSDGAGFVIQPHQKCHSRKISEACLYPRYLRQRAKKIRPRQGRQTGRRRHDQRSNPGIPAPCRCHHRRGGCTSLPADYKAGSYGAGPVRNPGSFREAAEAAEAHKSAGAYEPQRHAPGDEFII